jgi:Mn2+/Fe2+ NRAMP family transporter
VFAVAAIKLNPDWGQVAHGLLPDAGSGDLVVYGYFVVGLIGAAMVPYEVYFYSSGAVEERWTPKDLGVNRANAIIGYSHSVIFSVVVLPATYLPILLVANDRAYMGRHANGRLANVFGVGYLVIIVIIAIAAIPLMLASNMRQG